MTVCRLTFANVLGVLLLVEPVSAFCCAVFWVGVLELGLWCQVRGWVFSAVLLGNVLGGRVFGVVFLGSCCFGVSGWRAGVFVCDFWRVCVLFFLWWVFRFYGWRGRADFGGVGWGGCKPRVKMCCLSPNSA